MELFRRSADQGNAGGQFCLGLFYEHGKGWLAKDEGRARELYCLAAAGGNKAAKESLARRGWA